MTKTDDVPESECRSLINSGSTDGYIRHDLCEIDTQHSLLDAITTEEPTINVL